MTTKRILWATSGASLLVLAATLPAAAQPVRGPYVAVAGGGNILQDEEVRLSPEFPGGKERWGVGQVGLGSVGYGFGNGVRVEIEGNWRQNGLQHFLETPYPTISGGTQRNYGGMANVLFDMDIGQSWIYPYVGLGVGYAWQRLNLHTVAADGSLFEHVGGTTGGEFAYQAMFGVGVPVPWVVGLTATAEYRFFSALGPNGYSGTSIGTQGAFGRGPYENRTSNVDVTSDYNHSFLLGLRYEFNPAPPPPPPASAPVASSPAPAPARTYLVFFDWDRAVLTPRARQIVAEAAANSTHVATTTIEVDGYADTSHALPGDRGHDYNLKLSLRRADAVRLELVHDGVPAGVIAVHGYGDQHLLVATGPNVREPQNRRVEIILR